MLQLYVFGRPHLTRVEPGNRDVPLHGLSLAMLAALAIAAPGGSHVTGCWRYFGPMSTVPTPATG